MVDPKSGADGRKTLVEEGTRFRGSLSSTCPIEVNGRFEGDLAAPALTVNASGAIQGKVRVRKLESQGELAGDFEADAARVSGTVRDSTVIRAKSLEVNLAPANGKIQVVFGECELEIGEEPLGKDEAMKPAVVHPPSERPRTASTPPTKGEAVSSKAE